MRQMTTIWMANRMEHMVILALVAVLVGKRPLSKTLTKHTNIWYSKC